MRYHIVHVCPSDYVHTAALTELAELLEATFADLRPGTTRGAVFQPEAVNIVVGYHLLPNADDLVRHRSVVFQTEQLQPGREVWVELLRSAELVLDYSVENRHFLAQCGVDAEVVVLGHHDRLRRIVLRPERDIDVLFYGSVNPRRSAVLDELRRECVVHRAFGVYGGERDDLIARSKVVLNMHYYNTCIFEQVRVSYLLSNDVCVVSETSVSEPYASEPYKGVLVSGRTLVPYDDLASTVIDLCHGEADFKKVGQEAGRRFRKQTMHERLRKIVERLESRT